MSAPVPIPDLTLTNTPQSRAESAANAHGIAEVQTVVDDVLAQAEAWAATGGVSSATGPIAVDLGGGGDDWLTEALAAIDTPDAPPAGPAEARIEQGSRFASPTSWTGGAGGLWSWVLPAAAVAAVAIGGWWLWTRRRK